MKILVVEDEHKIANSIKKGLEQEAFVVDVAFEGKTGFDLASSEKYDVIILDLMLPEMDGVEICTKLRAEKNQTPILMLTAKGQLEDKVAGLNSGADDYLVKPFAFAELLARLRALGRRPQTATGDVLKAGDLVLNTSTFEVTHKNKPISLSRKEFTLLEFLMRHKNQIMSKDTIVNSVWEYDADILPNTVEVYIGYLRKKIPGKIITVRGFGYRIAS
jgi:DNA-binding response OmpR family regulator